MNSRISAHSDSYDIGCIEEISNNGRVLEAQLAVYDIIGTVHRVTLRYAVGASRPTYNDSGVGPADLVPWLDRFAGQEVLELCTEALADRREALKNLDTMRRDWLGWRVTKNQGRFQS